MISVSYFILFSILLIVYNEYAQSLKKTIRKVLSGQ